MSSADAGRPVPGSPRVHEVAPDDVADVQRVLESDPDYAIALTGYPPGPSDALSALMMEPDGFAGTKYAFGLWIDRELVAFADVLRAHPDAATLSIGLLLVVPDRRRQGLGTALHDGIVERAAAWDGIDRIRLGVVQAAAAGADPFWATLGYRRTAESAPYRYDHVVSTVRLWTRPLRSRDSAGDPAR